MATVDQGTGSVRIRPRVRTTALLRRLIGANELRDANGDVTPGNEAFARVAGHHPEFAAAFLEFNVVQRRARRLPKRLHELLRLRIAYRNDCGHCLSTRLDASCDVPPPSITGDTPGERAAVRFADLLATDHHQIDDALYEELSRYFDAAEIVEIGITCATLVGMGRLMATWFPEESA